MERIEHLERTIAEVIVRPRVRPQQQQQRENRLVLVNRKKQTEELCLEAVKKNAADLQWVQHQTPVICEAAVLRDVRALQFVKDPTPELLRTAIQRNSYAIRFVKDQTEELCWLALNANECTDMDGDLYFFANEAVHSLAYIRTPTPAMIEYAFQYCRCEDGCILQCVLQEMLTDAFILDYFANTKADPSYLYDRVLNFLRTPSPTIIDYVMSRSGTAIRWLEEVDITQALCEKAFQTNVRAIAYIPRALHTQEMVNRLLESKEIDDNLIVYVSPRFQTQEFWRRVVMEGHLEMIQECPEEFRTQEMCEAAVAYMAHFLEYVPAALQTPAMHLSAVERDGSCLEYIPVSERTQELCEKALDVNAAEALRYVPPQFLTKAFCETAFVKTPESIARIPKQFQTKAMCKKAVEHWPTLLRHCRFKTKDMCESAVHKKPTTFPAVPRHYRSEALCLHVVEHGNQFCWRMFKKGDYTEAVCHALLAKSHASIGQFPPPFQTRDMHILAVQSKPYAWNFIPKRFRSLDLVNALLLTGDKGVHTFFRESLTPRMPLYSEIKQFLSTCM